MRCEAQQKKLCLCQFYPGIRLHFLTPISLLKLDHVWSWPFFLLWFCTTLKGYKENGIKRTNNKNTFLMLWPLRITLKSAEHVNMRRTNCVCQNFFKPVVIKWKKEMLSLWILLRQKYTLHHFTTKIAVFLIFYFDFVEKNLSEIIFYLQCYFISNTIDFNS